MGALADNSTPEPTRRFTRSDGTVWDRTGYCSRCGECCTGAAHILTNEPTAQTPAGYCGAFLWDNNQHTIGFCLERCGRYYSMGCVDFPSDPHHLIDCPSCTYVFTQVP